MKGPEIAGVTYMVELLFEHDYDLDSPDLHAALRVLCPKADVRPTGRGIALFHRDQIVHLKDAVVCAQTAIVGSASGISAADLEPELQQTRDWPLAREVVTRSKRRLLVTDMMSASLPRLRRLEIFQRTLGAVVQAMHPTALVWRAAGKIVDPARLLAALASADDEDRLFLALNVRLFNVGNAAGECVMDTMGLASLGVPDLQLHFRGLDPNDVAGYLFNLAYYVLNKGDVIADGHTVDGLGPGKPKWSCRHEASLVGPSRVVVDIDPGPTFSAGRRSAEATHS